MLSELHRGGVDVAGLLTTTNAENDRVAMHGVRRSLVAAQAAAAGLPLEVVGLPHPCPNGAYEEAFLAAVERSKEAGVTHIAFGDLHLEDIRDYRVDLLKGTGVEPLFPLWCGAEGTPALSRAMVGGGLRAVVTCVDPKQLDAAFLGRTYDESFLDDLPAGVDPCAENGEFHTLCTHGPCFAEPLSVRVGERVDRGGFLFADVLPA